MTFSTALKEFSSGTVRGALTDSDYRGMLDYSLEKASELILSQQFSDGYWWYSLEANESINAEYIFLTHYIDVVDPVVEQKIARRIEHSQLPDGSWSLYFGGFGELNTTIECYLALKLAGYQSDSAILVQARDFILKHGGLTQVRAFTRIHLAQFGLIPWRACPEMPISLIHLPVWFPINIYEFSSWARASIVPLLVILDKKKTRQLPLDTLHELYIEANARDIDWSFKSDKSFFSTEQFLLRLDRFFKANNKFIPFKKSAARQCEKWIRDHLERTEDIYPALAYGIQALHSLGYSNDDPIIKKALNALYQFQHPQTCLDSAIPSKIKQADDEICQQCCISPVWDTPWAGLSLYEAGHNPKSRAMEKAGEWLLSKQILNFYGDWYQKNKNSLPGGWAFEFQNDYFPDIDDTIQVLQFLLHLNLPRHRIIDATSRALTWLLSMQSNNGGWAAFDVNNNQDILNKIPFSDHGACLDPPTADVTSRMLELLSMLGYTLESKPVKKAIPFLESRQEDNGSWWGRWGVNYIYGTWCVLQGLKAIDYDMKSPRILKSLSWLHSIQNPDGGFGESCESYLARQYIGLKTSVPSQTAWALMALIACGQGKSNTAKKAAQYLIQNQNKNGSWDEPYHTGTGFPGHFYLRYHGYRHYFPLLALAKYKKVLDN